MSSFLQAEVLDTHHWTERLFSFKTSREPSFRFENGQFVMIGLEIGGKPLLRAYSIASANYEDHLEFFSIKIENGPLTSVLRDIRPGQKVLLGKKATGTLLHDSLRPGRNLYLLATGTGLAPFLSLIRDPATYERYDRVVLAHGCRDRVELAYADLITNDLPRDEFLGESVREKLLYYPAATREPFGAKPRLTELVQNGALARDLGLADISARDDRFMLCGSMAMLTDFRKILETFGLREGSQSTPGDFIYEKAFVG